MKKIFLLLMLVFMANHMIAQTGYCTKATDANGNSTFYWENAQNFCPIMVSGSVYQSMQASGIKLDMQVDDITSHLWLWNGYSSLAANDENSFGDNGGYLDLQVYANAGWSGMGFINDAGLNMSFLDDTYYLHFGTRGYPDTHTISLGGVPFSIGNGVMDGNENLGTWKNDGKWYYFDIPVSKLKQMGSLFNSAEHPITNWKDNYLTALSGGTAGVELVLENIFLYQKKDPNAENPNIIDTGVDGDKPIEVPLPPYVSKANNADGTTTFNWEDAQNFCPIIVSQDVFQTMEATGIKLDMQVNDITSHMWIWNNTYNAQDASGLNSFGGNGGYIDLTVGSVGWSGVGLINDDGLNVSFMDDSYYLHFGTKGKPSTHTISLGGVAFCIGEGTMDNHENVGTWTNDGDWYYFDVPLGYLRQHGNLFPGAANYKDNYLTALSGGQTGTELILENVFIYQKKSLAPAGSETPDTNPNPNPEPEEETIPAGPYVAKANGFDWDNTYDYCPIIVSDDVFNRMNEKGIKLDMQVNDNTTHLYIWENTYSSKDASGQNSFGGEGGFIDLTVNGGAGWSGMGITTDANMDMSFLADKGYYLHFGTKGQPSTHTISLGDVAFCIGEGSMDGNKNLGTWENDGDWYYFDVPCALLKSMGKFFANCSATFKGNYLTALSGGNAGTELILENVFLYRKTSDSTDSQPVPEEEEIPEPPYSTKASAHAFDWDNADNFCPIIVSEDVFSKMEHEGIKLDMQVNDETSHLYVWENTYSFKEASEKNSFGTDGGYIDLTVNGGAGWSGMGLINTAGLNVSFLTTDPGYYLHFGTKGKPSTHTITLGGVAFCIGDGTMDGNKNLGTWENDGEWWYFDVPVSLIKTMGKFFEGASNYKDNYLTALSGGQAGTELILENVFIYHKKNVGGGGGGNTGEIGNLVDYTPEHTYTAARSFKRGIGENAFNNKAEMEALMDGVSWYYNWGATPVAAFKDLDVEYVPMAWNASGVTSAANCAKTNGCGYILGFNEPNFRSQANMTPTQAATAWKNLEDAVAGTDIKLVAPALNYPDGPINDGNTYQPEAWMDAFISAYKAQNGGREPRMDYLALHCYMNDHNAMKNFVENFAKKYGKQVWLTEFCAWEGTVTESQQKATMQQKVADLEQSEHVYRYAWFKAKGSSVAPYYRLLNGTSLTNIGNSYVYMSSFDTDKYYTDGEQIMAKDYVAATGVDLGASTDNDPFAAPLQITAFDMGASATYLIDVPADNDYTLVFRMSDRAYLSPLKVEIYLDNNAAPVATKQLSVTGKTATSDAWVTEGFALPLPAGKHSMKVRSAQSTDCSLQWLCFSRKALVEGIEDVEAETIGNGYIYNLAGQRVSENAKGILIKNGKKVLVK